MRLYAVFAITSVAFVSLLMGQSSASRLTVVVEDVSGAPIHGASVYVQHWVKRSQLIQDGIATTDDGGRVSFELAPNARYEVLASAPAFVAAVASVPLSSSHQGEQYVFKLVVSSYSGSAVESRSK